MAGGDWWRHRVPCVNRRPYPDLDRSAFILQEAAFRQNLQSIADVARDADVEIILALKAFSFWPTFPLVREYLPGATASSLNEAKLVYKHMQTKPHVYAPAYVPQEFAELLELSHTLTFNSLSEFERYRSTWQRAKSSVGLRVNPLYSPVKTELYNPASPTGRLGVAMDQLPDLPPEGLEGVHVHALFESDASSSAKLLETVTEGLGHWLPRLKWLNLGGGHLMTREGYDLQKFVHALRDLRSAYPNLHVTLEPGSAHAWQTGVLCSHVLDIIENHGVQTAMLDVSFTCHMPDTLEMPYRPQVQGTVDVAESSNVFVYNLGGSSCLAGDYIADYGFPNELEVGDQVIFNDMLHYTTVKSTMFNGVQHPDLVMHWADGRREVVRRFSFEDYQARLG